MKWCAILIILCGTFDNNIPMFLTGVYLALCYCPELIDEITKIIKAIKEKY